MYVLRQGPVAASPEVVNLSSDLRSIYLQDYTVHGPVILAWGDNFSLRSNKSIQKLCAQCFYWVLGKLSAELRQNCDYYADSVASYYRASKKIPFLQLLVVRTDIFFGTPRSLTEPMSTGRFYNQRINAVFMILLHPILDTRR